MANLDRTKHVVDVMEHVYGGVRASGTTDTPYGRLLSVDESSRVWLGGTLTSVVRISVADDDEGADR